MQTYELVVEYSKTDGILSYLYFESDFGEEGSYRVTLQRDNPLDLSILVIGGVILGILVIIVIGMKYRS